MGKITLWIDNVQVEAEEGKSVLNAALEAGIYIPHLCSHPDLTPQGGCKLCVVEIDGEAQPTTSCTTTVREGMRVKTKSETLDRLRRTSMQLMLAGHPHDCTGCRSFGNCELQAMMQYLNAVANPGMKRVHKETMNLNTNNPLIDREMERCIQCGRCVRVCNDVRGVGILHYNKKGDEVYVGTVNDLSLANSDCRFCGACVEVCPTGALQDKEGVFRKDLPREQALIPCTAECPAHINIPNYLRMIYAGEYGKAVGVIREKVPFPLSLGRVCTAYCEKGCKRKGLNGSVGIRDLKRFAVQHDTTQEWKEKSIHLPATGKKVAVIGGGAAGLTAAYYLAKKGHDVTVMERMPTAGGMMSYGIPSYRLPREDVQSEVDIICEAGVKIQYNTDVKNVADVKKDYDAVLVAVGASAGKVIPLEGYVPEQCTTAVDMLRAVSLGQPTNPEIGPGKKVLVYGGGNVAFDAARVSARLGAEVSVVCLEARDKMLADEEEITQAQEEGVKVYPGKTNGGFVVENGVITGLNIEGISSFKFGPNGLEVERIPDTKEVIPCDVVVFASGQKTDLTADFGLELNRFGYPVYDQPKHSTALEGVFVAGDVVTGTKAVINAIAEGRAAAEEMDAYLGGDGNIEEHLADLPAADPNIGKIEGFAFVERNHTAVTPCAERCGTFKPVDGGYTEEQAKAEAARCLKCPLRNQLHKTQMWTAYVK